MIPSAVPITGGIFEAKGGAVCAVLRMPLPPLDTDSDRAWVQLVPGEGGFAGHSDGAFKFTAEIFSKIVENFEVRRTPVACDYEHDKTNPTMPGYEKITSARVLATECRDGADGAQLWALMEFTPRAAAQIRARERNFTSPVVAFKHPNAVTGKDQGATLLMVALTDTPFLDGQEPVRLSSFVALRADRKETVMPTPEEEKKAAEVKALAEKTEEEKKAAEVKALAEEVPPTDVFLDALSKATGLDRVALTKILMENIDVIAAKLNLAADTKGTEAAALSELQQDKVQGLVVRLSAQVSSLEERLGKRDEADAVILASDNEARIASLIEGGFLLSAKKATALSLLQSNPKAFNELYADAPKVVPIGVKQATIKDKDGADVVQLSDIQQLTFNNAKSMGLRGGDETKIRDWVLEQDLG